MIVVGIILLLCAYLLPDVIPVPPGIIHVLTVLGWIGIVVGLILLLFGHFSGRSLAGRRYWY
jgi:Family of unknown function (DUF6131)